MFCEANNNAMKFLTLLSRRRLIKDVLPMKNETYKYSKRTTRAEMWIRETSVANC